MECPLFSHFQRESIELSLYQYSVMKPKAPNDNRISQSHQSCIGPLIVAIKSVLRLNYHKGYAVASSSQLA